jgi:hypothetical protein
MYRDMMAILLAGLLLFGCIGPGGTSVEQPSDATGEGPQQPAAYDAGTGAADGGSDADAQASGPPSAMDGPASVQDGKVLIMGRSVAYHWMEYLGFDWTCDDEECATGSPRGTYEGYDLIYYELDYPPDIARSAAEGVDLYGDDAGVVFFKFCFVDFAADDTLQNAKDNEALVEDVYEYIVIDRGKKLIIGNALPQVSAHTEPALLSNHQEFNSWLDGFAASHEDVQVLDLNGILSDSGGSLKPGYAISSDDSHLTSAAYAEMTSEFMDLLKKA